MGSVFSTRTMLWSTELEATGQSRMDRSGYSLHFFNLLSVYFPELVDIPVQLL